MSESSFRPSFPWLTPLQQPNLRLPSILQPTKRKLFVTFHHADNYYRELFDSTFSNEFISVSVDPGDIDPDNEDEYIKRIIQQENIVQASVIVSLYGANTYGRKHVDWEISAALSEKVGGHKGFAVLLLPTFPHVSQLAAGLFNIQAVKSYLHPRTYANLESGYARLYFWPNIHAGTMPVVMRDVIETAFRTREENSHLIQNFYPQYKLDRA